MFDKSEQEPANPSARRVPEPGVPTLDQLAIFLAVADAGSFGGAARDLRRAVSAISYGIAQLEAQLGLVLFDRGGSRRPVLTEAGRALLSEARGVAGGVDALRATARGLLGGLEGSVDLAVDVMVPPDRLGAILRDFAHRFPTVPLRLHVEALGAVNALVLAGDAVLGISGPLHGPLDALDWVDAGATELIPVAAPTHPLARRARISPDDARAHVQLVLTDRSPLTAGQDFSVLSPRTWRLADLGAKHNLLRQGIGWGNMPRPLVEADLLGGTLVRLALPVSTGGPYPFVAVWRRDAPPGPAAAWLRDRFAAAAGA